MSTFHGLEMAKQALYAQQSALYTTGHNISNANTEGYSRQRVNFNTMQPFPSGSRNRPQMPGQMGTGVEIGAIQRVRNNFLDYQFRAENSKSGYWDTRSDALGRLEELLNEPSDSGLSKTMDQFWDSLQELAANPDNSGARSVVAHRGFAVAETFNHLSKSITSMREDLQNQINVTTSDANSLLRQINELNNQIKQVEPHGYVANDLYDDRDRLIDELSEIVNIKVKHDKTSDGAKDIADGIVSIELVDRNGQSMNSPPIMLLDGTARDQSKAVHELDVTYNDDGAVQSISVEGYDRLEPLALMESVGSLKGLIESYGYVDEDGDLTGEYPDMLAELDTLAAAFADEFNKVHRMGEEGDDAQNFFSYDETEGAAASLTVLKEIMDEPGLINASTDASSGSGDNALALADVFSEDLDALDGTTVNDFFGSLIGQLGVSAEESNRMSQNPGVLRSQVEEQRMSVSGVSLDEEMSNMIKFQHAYSAAARSMTTIDERIDRIINNMGLVGR